MTVTNRRMTLHNADRESTRHINIFLDVLCHHEIGGYIISDDIWANQD